MLWRLRLPPRRWPASKEPRTINMTIEQGDLLGKRFEVEAAKRASRILGCNR